MMPDQSSIRIAIVGGGIGGILLANGLHHYPQLDYHVYESAPAFKERGASVGCSANAQRALRAMGLDMMLDDAHGVKASSSRSYIGEGENAGTFVCDKVSEDEGLIVVHRAALLSELLKRIPAHRLHTSKKVMDISNKHDHQHAIRFEDGATQHFHMIVGADGIHSFVKRYVLGPDDPAAHPVFAGFWDCRNIVPAALAAERLGCSQIDLKNPRQHAYWGQGTYMLSDIISGGEAVCIVGAGIVDEADTGSSEWRKHVSREWFEKQFAGWESFGKDMLDLLLHKQETPSVSFMWESAEPRSLVNDAGSIVVIGDAAQAPLPFQGSGAALTMEDAFILASLLGKCTDAADTRAALRAFSSVRLPRRKAVADSSRGTGHIVMGNSEYGLDPVKLREIVPRRWDHIVGWSPQAELKEAMVIFDQLKRE